MTIIKDAEKHNNGFPFLNDLLNFYKKNFDADQAKKDGKITPLPKINPEYDNALEDLKENQRKFDNYIIKQSKILNCNVKYFGSNKNRFQLEIPEEKCKKLPATYELTSSKKGFKR